MESKILLKDKQADPETNRTATKKRTKKLMEDKYFEGGKKIDLTKKRKPLPQDKCTKCKKAEQPPPPEKKENKKKYLNKN